MPLTDFLAGASLSNSDRLELHLTFADAIGGERTARFGVVFNTDEATTLTDVNGAVDAIEAALPPNTLKRAMLGQVLENIGTPAPEANVEERIVITLARTGQPDIPVKIYAPAAYTASGTLITLNGRLNQTNTEFVNLLALFTPGTEKLLPISEGEFVTGEAVRRSRYKPSGNAKGRKRTVHG